MLEVGKVRWLSGPLGYGFIERDDGTSYYVHYTQLDRRSERPLVPGERVEFEIELGTRGPQATHVTRALGASALSA
jgi:CspA family cold shock protein